MLQTNQNFLECRSIVRFLYTLEVSRDNHVRNARLFCYCLQRSLNELLARLFGGGNKGVVRAWLAGVLCNLDNLLLWKERVDTLHKVHSKAVAKNSDLRRDSHRARSC